MGYLYWDVATGFFGTLNIFYKSCYFVHSFRDAFGYNVSNGSLKVLVIWCSQWQQVFKFLDNKEVNLILNIMKKYSSYVKWINCKRHHGYKRKNWKVQIKGNKSWIYLQYQIV